MNVKDQLPVKVYPVVFNSVSVSENPVNIAIVSPLVGVAGLYSIVAVGDV